MTENKKQRRQLIVNIVLTLLVFITLITCIVAWFASVDIASISEMKMYVDRADLQLESPVTEIDFPCATKIADTSTTPTLFNTECAVYKDYVINVPKRLNVSVRNIGAGPGMLAYVCDDANTVDFYGEMVAKLKQYATSKGKTLDKLSFEELQTALNSINSRGVGTVGETSVTVRVVYWVEYEQAKELLQSETYFDSSATGSADLYKAKLVFRG